MEDLYGVGDSRWLAIAASLPGDVLWGAAAYAKGRGADTVQVQRLAMAAW